MCRRLTAETASNADPVRLFDKEISKHDRIEKMFRFANDSIAEYDMQLYVL